jgi:hypothetical protein
LNPVSFQPSWFVWEEDCVRQNVQSRICIDDYQRPVTSTPNSYCACGISRCSANSRTGRINHSAQLSNEVDWGTELNFGPHHQHWFRQFDLLLIPRKKSATNILRQCQGSRFCRAFASSRCAFPGPQNVYALSLIREIFHRYHTRQHQSASDRDCLWSSNSIFCFYFYTSHGSNHVDRLLF